ncbi:hypothetical protein, partial [Fibrobacter succinogenes]|uniref:hypothetical protein n=1 Tax=Fibrobacter succinogenes TaxID=833 RepID=UPI001967822E
RWQIDVRALARRWYCRATPVYEEPPASPAGHFFVPLKSFYLQYWQKTPENSVYRNREHS